MTEFDHTHVAEGDADSRQPVHELEAVASGLPTRKWKAARIVALATLATLWAKTGEWTEEETIFLIGIFSEGALSYVLPNQPTPGGVPER